MWIFGLVAGMIGLLVGLIAMVIVLVVSLAPFLIIGFVIRQIVVGKKKSSFDNSYKENKDVYSYQQNKDAREDTSFLYKYFENKDTFEYNDEYTLKKIAQHVRSVSGIDVYKNSSYYGNLSELSQNNPDLVNAMLDALKQHDGKSSIPKQQKSKIQDYIDRFNQLKESIKETETLIMLDQLLVYLDKLDYLEKSNKIDKDRLKKVNDRYLPMLYQMVVNYKDIVHAYQDEETIEKANFEINKSLTLVNEAFEKLLLDGKEEGYLHLNSDMATLESLLKQDGLIDDGLFDGNKK